MTVTDKAMWIITLKPGPSTIPTRKLKSWAAQAYVRLHSEMQHASANAADTRADASRLQTAGQAHGRSRMCRFLNYHMNWNLHHETQI